MKRIACKKCGRQRWARPAAGQDKDARRIRPLVLMSGVTGRDVMVSSLEARQEHCLPCRRGAEKRQLRPIRSKVFGEMTREVIRHKKTEESEPKRGRQVRAGKGE